jgi:hypothetical protein
MDQLIRGIPAAGASTNTRSDGSRGARRGEVTPPRVSVRFDGVREDADPGDLDLDAVTGLLDPDLMLAGVARGVPVVPGALTPSEILRAMALGASAVKLFPVSSVGGPEYVRAVLEPIPDARFVVSGEATSTRSASTRDGFSPRPQIRGGATAHRRHSRSGRSAAWHE